MNSRTKARQFTADDIADYVASFRRERGMWAAFKHYQAFDQDAADISGADLSKSLGLPVQTIGCVEGSGETLARQLSSAGYRNLKSVVFDSCAHWIFEENPADTMRTIGDFLAAAAD
jgi:hypothetical protein